MSRYQNDQSWLNENSRRGRTGGFPSAAFSSATYSSSDVYLAQPREYLIFSIVPEYFLARLCSSMRAGASDLRHPA